MQVAVTVSGLVEQVDRGGMRMRAERIADQRAEHGADQRADPREEEIEYASEQLADRGADADGAADRTEQLPADRAFVGLRRHQFVPEIGAEQRRDAVG